MLYTSYNQGICDDLHSGIRIYAKLTYTIQMSCVRLGCLTYISGCK